MRMSHALTKCLWPGRQPTLQNWFIKHLFVVDQPLEHSCATSSRLPYCLSSHRLCWCYFC